MEIFISVDIESSGPVPAKYSMLSVGACVVGNAALRFYAELKPVSDEVVPDAMRIVGKSLEHFQRAGRDPAEVMSDFRKWVAQVAAKRAPVFVGFNAAFDWAFVNWYFHIFLQDNPFGLAPLDIKAFFMGSVGCAWAQTRSDRLPKKYRSSSPHEHHALSDAIEQAEMFEKMARDSGVRI